MYLYIYIYTGGITRETHGYMAVRVGEQRELVTCEIFLCLRRERGENRARELYTAYVGVLMKRFL